MSERKKYIIGIDGGSQSTKVVIFDLEGKIEAYGKEALQPLHMPKQGIAEHPDDDLWNSLVIASRRAMENFTGNPADILGVGLCTIRCCRAILHEDGSLAAPVRSWMDMRLSRPYEHKDPSVRYVTTSSGYIGCRMTGEFRDTASNYEGQWPIDKKTWNWSSDPEVISRYNIPKKMLFELVMPGDELGKISSDAAVQTCIPKGLPVFATANDKAVEALGAGLQEGNSGLLSLGTYIGFMVYGSRNVPEAQNFFSNMASIPRHFLYESGGIRRGMWTISWFRKVVGDNLASEERLNSEAEKVPPGSDGLLTVMDWLAPPDEPYKKGLMIGFDGRHGRGHIYRSILEAIALTMKNHADAMCLEIDRKLERITVSGGGSNSDVFMQIIADVFGIPSVRSEVNEAASIGAAVCAATGLGIYKDFETAVEKMVRIRGTFDPIEENRALYQRTNSEVYKSLTDQTDIILKRSYQIFK